MPRALFIRFYFNYPLIQHLLINFIVMRFTNNIIIIIIIINNTGSNYKDYNL
jgi:hypothetical protein